MYLVKTALLFLLFIAAECVYSQPCTLIVSEHTELDESNLRDHLSWLRSYSEDTNQQLILHLCTRDDLCSRYGSENISAFLSKSDSLLSIDKNRNVDFETEYEFLSDSLFIRQEGECLSSSNKVKVIIATPNCSENKNDIDRLIFIRKLALTYDWVESNGDVKENVEIILVNGYMTGNQGIKIKNILL
jgi:hypothetical protein